MCSYIYGMGHICSSHVDIRPHMLQYNMSNDTNVPVCTTYTLSPSQARAWYIRRRMLRDVMVVACHDRVHVWCLIVADRLIWNRLCMVHVWWKRVSIKHASRTGDSAIGQNNNKDMCIHIRIRSTQEQDERVMWDGRTIFELHNRTSHGALLILIAPYSYIPVNLPISLSYYRKLCVNRFHTLLHSCWTERELKMW